MVHLTLLRDCDLLVHLAQCQHSLNANISPSLSLSLSLRFAPLLTTLHAPHRDYQTKQGPRQRRKPAWSQAGPSDKDGCSDDDDDDAEWLPHDEHMQRVSSSRSSRASSAASSAAGGYGTFEEEAGSIDTVAVAVAVGASAAPIVQAPQAVPVETRPSVAVTEVVLQPAFVNVQEDVQEDVLALSAEAPNVGLVSARPSDTDHEGASTKCNMACSIM